MFQKNVDITLERPRSSRIEFIRDFKLYEIGFSDIQKSNGNVIYFSKQINENHKIAPEFGCDNFRDFPVIILHDGTTWVDMNLFLLEKLKQFPIPKSSSLRSLAYDLKAFRDWLDIENIDYCDVTAKYKLSLPTYKFMRHLRSSIEDGKLKSSTACRMMGSVVQFYRWLKATGKVQNKKLWTEDRSTLSYGGELGVIRKDFISTDLVKALRRVKSTNVFENNILDGASLRPLSLSEVKVIRNQLIAIGNIEMELAFEIALTTGARMQTVFTLRKQNFLQNRSNKNSLNRIAIGGGSSVKSKYDKEHVLLVPEPVMERMRIYLSSERYQRRLSLCEHQRDDKNTEYVFLTKSGKAYYLAADDPNYFKYNSSPTGASVGAFIRSTLLSKLKSSGHDFPFKFHDIRATFGVQLVELKRRKIHSDSSEGKTNLTNVNYLNLLNYVRERMGHSSLRVTERYLTFCNNNEMHYTIQAEFEDLILGHLENAL